MCVWFALISAHRSDLPRSESFPHSPSLAASDGGSEERVERGGDAVVAGVGEGGEGSGMEAGGGGAITRDETAGLRTASGGSVASRLEGLVSPSPFSAKRRAAPRLPPTQQPPPPPPPAPRRSARTERSPPSPSPHHPPQRASPSPPSLGAAASAPPLPSSLPPGRG